MLILLASGKCNDIFLDCWQIISDLHSYTNLLTWSFILVKKSPTVIFKIHSKSWITNIPFLLPLAFERKAFTEVKYFSVPDLYLKVAELLDITFGVNVSEH